MPQPAALEVHMYKTIIVPIDVSHTEKAPAMISAARHLSDNHTSIVLTSIVEELPAHISAEFPGNILDDAKRNAQATLEELARDADLNAVVDIRIGHAHTSILGLADEKDAYMIIVASHKPGLSDYFLGSTAARIVRHAKCSVLVLR